MLQTVEEKLVKAQMALQKAGIEFEGKGASAEEQYAEAAKLLTENKVVTEAGLETFIESARIETTITLPGTVRKRNGVGDNRGFAGDEAAKASKEKLIESAKCMGLSQREAELFAMDEGDLRAESWKHLLVE